MTDWLDRAGREIQKPLMRPAAKTAETVVSAATAAPHLEESGISWCTVTPIAALPKPRAPVNLDEALRAACAGVAGITTTQFRSLLSPEDITDIEAGALHRKTLRAFAQSFAEGIRSGRVVVLVERAP